MKKPTTASRLATEKNVTKPKSGTVKKTTKAKKTVATKSTPSAVGTLKVGQKAPAFSLLDDKSQKVTLSSLKGKNVVLYFYPKDDTPGCTKEACAFRDGIKEIRKRGAVVLGVSGDSVESHQKFSKKFRLNFPLLSDAEKNMLKKYGVWKEKSLYGRKFMGIERTTFVIDAKGKVAAVFPKVKVDKHFDEVVSTLEAIET